MKIVKCQSKSLVFVVLPALAVGLCTGLCGCRGGFSGYSNEWLHPEDVSTVYVEMFDSKSFRRGFEYDLTDALAKRIEADTPYKVVSNRDQADSVIGGYISSIGSEVLVAERQTGRALEKDLEVVAVVKWKNLKTGELLIANQTVKASASYSMWLDQGQGYAAALASNRLAERIVELMEKKW